ncbi:MAG TPA: glycosyltransferase [Candidatus Saccharimonadales bacterium]
MKIAVITCYYSPDYVRARTLRAALKTFPDVKLSIVKNRHKGLLRYPEVLWKLWQVRKKRRPDVYVLTFRGQEILPFVLLMAGDKPVWFDEFIVPIAYASHEGHRKSFGMRVKHFLARVSEPLYKNWLRRCSVVLADTRAHAELSARTSHMNLSKYLAVPVGTDETLFRLAEVVQRPEKFQVFYYSTGMQPLHGIPVVLEAARQLQNHKDIEFLIVGGKKVMRSAVASAQASGARLRYEPWIPFEELVTTIQSSSLCLGGPLGGTPQARHVITGKTYQFLACGVPVLVGASEATSEYFVDKQNALVVEQDDAGALVRAIAWAAKHPNELRAIAENGRKLYEKQFSTKAIAGLLAPLIDGVS